VSKRTPDSEFKKFDGFMHALIQVPHSAVKAALDQEKEEKQKRKAKKKPSALVRESREQD